jgi:DNA-binding MarR family transcriptional regulator
MSDLPHDPDAARAEALATELRGLFVKLKRRLREQGSSGDLPPSQVAVIVRLDREGPLTVTGLANAEGVRSQSMGATVAALEAAGMVAGAPHPTDGRQTLLSLTPACRRLLHDGRAARQDWLLRTLQDRLTPDEQRQLEAAFPLLNRIVD